MARNVPDPAAEGAARVRWSGRIRWQLALFYMLGGALPVLLVAVFAYVVANMLVMRGSINTIERQVELVVQMAAGRLDLVEQFAMLQAEAMTGEPPRSGRRPGPGQKPRPTPKLQGVHARIRCQSAKGAVMQRFLPPGATLEVPSWLTADHFAAVTFEHGRPVIRAFSRTQHDNCTVEALLETPVTERVREMIGRASGLEIELARQNRTNRAGKKTPPSLPTVAWSNLLGRFDRGVGAVVSGNDWQTGAQVRRPIFLVRPNLQVAWSQMAQLGAQERRWVWGLAMLAAAFLLVEIIAAALAIHLARRIVRATNLLTTAAHMVGAGNLQHRIPITKHDQLGQLGVAFNQMTESVERLLVETKGKQRMEEELRIAHQMQESLLPRVLPLVEKARLAAVCLPARNVSGDLYDVLELGPGRVGLLCADVSGKGIAAALLTANVQALVRVLTGGNNGAALSPGKLLARINRELVRRIPRNAFVTLFWAEYDSNRQLLRWANAGHCPPLLLGSEQEIWLSEGGLPVGMFDATDYVEQERVLPPGSLLVAYTDGVPEAERDDGEPFGEERLAALCRNLAPDGPARLVERIVKSVHDWSGGRDPHDDVTLLVLQTQKG